MTIEPVYAVIIGYEPGSAVAGPCGSHRYRVSMQTPEGIQTPYVVVGSVEACWPPTVFVEPLPIGRAIFGLRIREGANTFRHQWFYRETPQVVECNPTP